MEPEFELSVSFLSELSSRIETTSEDDLEKLLEAFRTLRKICAGNKEFQVGLTPRPASNSIHQVKPKFTEAASTLSDLSIIFTWLRENSKDDLLNVGLQAVGNMIVQHRDNQIKVWNIMGFAVRGLVKSPNKKISYVSSMILYNILLGISETLASCDFVEILKNILPYEEETSEFIGFIVELLVSLQATEKVYEQLCKDGKLHLLDTIHNMIMEQDKSPNARPVPPSSVLFLVEQFKRRNFYILKTSDKYADLLEPCEVSKLLDIISAASSRSPYMSSLQKDRSLLIDCTYVLKGVHMAGKAGNPEHAPLTQLSDFSNQILPNATSAGASVEVVDSPTFNFKSALIRLLGNLCWKNRENQDEVREMDGIPLLLDCCHIDARNPLLIQWVILAIRNLCDGNTENQAVIAAMNREGVVESRLLHELGLTLNKDQDGKTIRVVPLRK